MIAPKIFSSNSIGVFDMVGNVWEITDDLFNVNYYSEISTEKELKNLKVLAVVIIQVTHMNYNML